MPWTEKHRATIHSHLKRDSTILSDECMRAIGDCGALWSAGPCAAVSREYCVLPAASWLQESEKSRSKSSLRVFCCCATITMASNQIPGVSADHVGHPSIRPPHRHPASESSQTFQNTRPLTYSWVRLISRKGLSIAALVPLSTVPFRGLQ